MLPRSIQYLPCDWSILRVEASDAAVLRITVVAEPLGDACPNELTRACCGQLMDYLAGTRLDFDLPYQVEGTEFQQAVWAQLARIPYGEMLSYQEIAVAIARPKACRAVGSACGANPLLILLPCHRVITANQQLGGYAAGLDMKSALLAMEARTTK